ncbi:MAG: hypothetical protein Ct9H300mP4_08770 [Gammaproteobacteria bacterium]|nr:MAG: hypothetical protein Ct9H300mP4_08770 [Gammaproteobacteria bacterium]
MRNESAYLIYLKSIAYSFYPIFMLVFVMTIAGSGRDFASMFKYETEAELAEILLSKVLKWVIRMKLKPIDWSPKILSSQSINAVIPIALFIGSVIGGLFVTGKAVQYRKL